MRFTDRLRTRKEGNTQDCEVGEQEGRKEEPSQVNRGGHPERPVWSAEWRSVWGGYGGLMLLVSLTGSRLSYEIRFWAGEISSVTGQVCEGLCRLGKQRREGPTLIQGSAMSHTGFHAEHKEANGHSYS